MALVLNGDGKISGANLNIDSDGAATFTGLTVETTTAEENAVLVKDNSATDVGSLRINNGAFIVKGYSTSQPVQLQTHDGNEDIEVDPDGFIKMETAGLERMRLDASGRATIPYQPFFHASGSSSHTATKGAVLPFSQVVTNIGSHYNDINRRFTCPIAGRYFFSVGCRYNTTTGSYVRFTLRKNGSLEASGLGIVDPIIDGSTSTGYKHGTQVVILNCAANDYFEVIDYSNNTNQVYQLNESHFIGYLLG